jgi:hypothetical protein
MLFRMDGPDLGEAMQVEGQGGLEEEWCLDGEAR